MLSILGRWEVIWLAIIIQWNSHSKLTWLLALMNLTNSSKKMKIESRQLSNDTSKRKTRSEISETLCKKKLTFASPKKKRWTLVWVTPPMVEVLTLILTSTPSWSIRICAMMAHPRRRSDPTLMDQAEKRKQRDLRLFHLRGRSLKPSLRSLWSINTLKNQLKKN